MNLKMLLEVLEAHQRTVYIDTTTLKWGSEYDGGVFKTHHTCVRVGDSVISYDYKNIKELIRVLQALPEVRIVVNGEWLDEGRHRPVKDN